MTFYLLKFDKGTGEQEEEEENNEEEEDEEPEVDQETGEEDSK
jgi:hypothetical protein